MSFVVLFTSNGRVFWTDLVGRRHGLSLSLVRGHVIQTKRYDWLMLTMLLMSDWSMLTMLLMSDWLILRIDLRVIGSSDPPDFRIEIRSWIDLHFVFYKVSS